MLLNTVTRKTIGLNYRAIRLKTSVVLNAEVVCKVICENIGSLIHTRSSCEKEVSNGTKVEVIMES